MFLKKNIIAFSTVSAGTALLAAAWKLGHFLPGSYAPLVYAYDFLLWIYAACCIVVLSMRSGFSTTGLNRALLVFGVFALTVFPYHVTNFEMLTTRSVSLAGGTLLLFGLIAWRPVHGLLAHLAKPLRRIAACPPGIFALLVFVIFLCEALGLAWRCFEFIPGFGDAISQYIQAKFIARGHLYGEAHPLQAFFDPPMTVLNHGKWYAQYSPGHIFALALGHVVNAPWLVNPLDGALTVLALYALARCICDEAIAKLAVVLMMLSQFTLLMSAEFMNHSTALLCTTLFLLCYVKTLQALPDKNAPVELWAIGAGLSLGALFLTRPLSAIGAGAPFVLYALWLICRQPRAHIIPFLLMAMSGLLCLQFQLWYDLQLTGNMWLLPSGVFHQASNINAMGFGDHNSLWKSILKVQDEWECLNLSLFEWFIPSTLFVWVACLRPLENRYQRLLLAMLFTYTASDMANQFHSYIFGPRYVYELSTALFILSAVGIRRVPALLASWPRFCPPRDALGGILAVILFACFVPAVMHGLPGNLRLYGWHYFNNHPDFYYPLVAEAKTPALVFIEAPVENDLTQNPDKKYDWMAFTLPPFDDSPIIFAKDLGKVKNRLFMQYYPGRNVYSEQKGTLYEYDKAAQP